MESLHRRLSAAGVMVVALLVVTAPVAWAVADQNQEVIDPAVAQADPDFAFQGEYLGKGEFPGADCSKLGAQVIALGEGQFRVVLYQGGLPGAGWRRGDARIFLEGRRQGELVELDGRELSGRIQEGKLVLTDEKDKLLAALEHIERKSPTLGQRPPEGAVVLFDGTSVENFQDGELTPMGTLDAGCTLKQQYRIARLHLEFRLSWKPKARGQARSNSGVYIGGIPEIQVLDSFGLEGAKNECGAFYGRRQPDVNMCLPPLQWQTYDVVFRPPPRRADGKPKGNYRVTVRHNGVVIHKNYDTGRQQLGLQRLHLQQHGNHVQYRNIWIVEREEE